jgi:hypothetical protein
MVTAMGSLAVGIAVVVEIELQSAGGQNHVSGGRDQPADAGQACGIRSSKNIHSGKVFSTKICWNLTLCRDRVDQMHGAGLNRRKVLTERASPIDFEKQLQQLLPPGAFLFLG